MEFRRELSAVSSLAVLLVVASSVLLGFVFAALIPGLGVAAGIALGAIISPTDAVAVSIVRKAGVSERVLTVLQGESMLNDASALVVLRTAIAATAATVSLWSAVGNFLYVVAAAAAIGFVVGKLSLSVRSRAGDARVNTMLSFAAPFVASIPAERLGASGLVAAVVAGLVVGRGGPRRLPPRHRLSDRQTWAVASLVLEGAVFLLMGLELSSIVADVHSDHRGVWNGLALGALALVLTVAVRGVYITPLIARLRLASRRAKIREPRAAAKQRQLSQAPDVDPETASTRREELAEELEKRRRSRAERKVYDLDYFLAKPLGWGDGAIITWAGMRGVVTVAAAQTLPADTPSRPLLVFVAFVVAAASLLLQGSTLSWVANRFGSPAPVAQPHTDEETRRLAEILQRAAETTVQQHPSETTRAVYRRLRSRAHDDSGGTEDLRQLQIKVIAAQREALLDARDTGTVGSSLLDSTLDDLDAQEITIDMQGRNRS